MEKLLNVYNMYHLNASHLVTVKIIELHYEMQESSFSKV